MKPIIKTTVMNSALKAELISLGWNPEKVLWGRRVDGDMHGVTIEYNGKTRYWPGPGTCIRGGDQIAIVR